LPFASNAGAASARTRLDLAHSADDDEFPHSLSGHFHCAHLNCSSGIQFWISSQFSRRPIAQFTTRFIPDGTAEQHQWFNQLERISTSPQNAVRIFHVFYRIDVTALGPLVACPTLVLHSTRDERVPFDEGRLLANLIPDARFVPLESRNHILLEHEPAWRRWIEEVRAFLPTTSGRADAVGNQRSPSVELFGVELGRCRH